MVSEVTFWKNSKNTSAGRKSNSAETRYTILNSYFQKQPAEVFCKKAVLKNIGP